ncbi:Ig domain-containing protein [Enhygromyxa salina]|nr:Ig domain-containing protein [Enhygromyxa salina]
MLPDGAVGAEYDHLPVGGGSDNFSGWMATNLPPGLSIDPDTGLISGIPAPSTSNQEYGDITVSIFDERLAQSVEFDCGPLLINERINANAVRNEPLHCIPHTASKAEMIAILEGGDGTEITCSAFNESTLPCPLGDGNGRLPPGISLDEGSCTHTGSVTGDVRGTWVWMVGIEQSGFKTRVPFCASNQTDSFHEITVIANGKEVSDLLPVSFDFDPNMGLLFGDGAYEWQIDDPACSNDPSLCSSYGFSFNVTCSPFDQPFVLNGMSTTTGMAHGMTLAGPAPSAGFATRPFVHSLESLYCTSNNGASCDVDGPNFEQNAQTQYHFSVVGYPLL